MFLNRPKLFAIGTGLLSIAVTGYVLLEGEGAVGVKDDATQTLSLPLPKSATEPTDVEVVVPDVDPAPEPESPAVFDPGPIETDFVLPLLNGSDELIRDALVGMSRHEGMNQWVAVSDLIRKFVGFINGISEGHVLRDPVRFLAPNERFLAKPISDDVYLMDAASYTRYLPFVSVIESLDSQDIVDFYVLVHPLLEQGYSELGLPGGSVNEIVFKAVGRLLEVPVITGEIRLKRPVVMYEFENPELERLSPAQKQLLRMGPKNVARLQKKLSDISRKLRVELEAS
jgi:hypothetical protein